MSKQSEFVVGDIVQLKSGGPDMTVKAIPRQHASYYVCQWFAGKKLESGDFQPDSLKVVSPKE